MVVKSVVGGSGVVVVVVVVVKVKVNGDTDQDESAANRREGKGYAREKLVDQVERCKQCWRGEKLVVTSLQS
jgi:hypothetical protein